MATSSLLGGVPMPEEISGKDLEALGPSDNSDSGSDAKGAYGDDELDSDSDSVGTGERAAVGKGGERADADILPDHLESDGTDLSDEGADSVADVEELQNLAADESDDVDDADPDAG